MGKIIALANQKGGVGKTTTIAKLAYSLMEQKKAKVALLAADTYRIAAVDQLRTYADIMNVPLFVIYSETELEEYKAELEKYDVVFVYSENGYYVNQNQTNSLNLQVAPARGIKELI